MGEVPDEKRPSALVATTPVPNWILDEVLPQLGDTELRVLLVVVRSTLGWHEGRGRKERDWISHRQLQIRTGRSSAVVSRAVDSLVQRGLIAVTDAEAEPLLTAKARSRAQGRLYYKLAWPQNRRDWPWAATVESRTGEASPAQSKDTLESEVSRGLEMLPKAESTSESEALLVEATSETSPPKVRTTKETRTKEMKKTRSELITLRIPTLENEVHSLDLGGLLPPSENKSEEGALPLTDLENAGGESAVATEKTESCSGKESAGVEPRGDAAMSPEVSQFIGAFLHQYGIHKPGCEVPPLRHEDYALLQRRLAQYSLKELESWLLPFFACSFGYVRRRHWSLGSYLESLTILRTAHAAKRKMGQSTIYIDRMNSLD